MAGNGREVIIYGAGMSGLIAAINLAKDGYSVTVHDRESGYGGSQLYNPSTHVTPIDTVATSEYIGINISSVFHQVARPIPFYFHDTPMPVPGEAFYAVERGDRATSLDTLLFEECKRLDIRFEFNSALDKNGLSDLPPNSIIACGLTPSAYKMLDIPFLPWYGWISRGELNLGSYAWIWWDECISEYGYLSSVNGYYFDLLFSNREVSRKCLRKYTDFMVRNEGVEHDNWQYVSGAVPLAEPDNPRLFWGDHILCGTISGAMDPWFWFGISGALVTGKVAAIAVTDREKALREFERFTRKFRLIYNIKNRFWYPYFRPRVKQNEKAINMVGTSTVETVGRMVDRGAAAGMVKMGLVPGFGRYNYS